MPNTKPISRAMDWEIAKEEMPDRISKHLPSGDPVENHEEIKREIETMLAVGPEGKEIVEMYVDGNITETQMEQKLDEVVRSENTEQLERFRSNLRLIREETKYPVWKEMIPLMFSGPNRKKIVEAAQQMGKFCSSDSENDRTESLESDRNLS